ncbi:hypothetical protein ACHAWU_003519 [Discostella pseudostelligera]|uniref:Uncharacterized protein n=1 Tax=Discostella pseudostelligera TaxID=259834 RepID=A0ABD3LYE3_9STRA
MSDDSSSSSSEDDDLLQSPIFKKPATRRGVDRAEKTKLDFFASCLKGSDARTDVHRRIAEVDVEFGLTNATTKETERQDQGEGKEDEKKEEKDGNDSDSDDDEILLTDLGRLAEEASAQKQKEVAQRKQNEYDYWAKIDSFAEKNAPGNSRDVHSARRKLSDAVSGLEYTSDLSDEEGGDGDTTNGGMSRKQLRSEAEAKSQGSYSHLGLRKMLFRRRINDSGTEGKKMENDERATTMALVFNTRQEAMDDFKSIVTSLQKEYRVPRTRPEEAMRILFIDPLVKITKSPASSIWDNVYHFLVKNPILSGRYAIHLPISFCEWMFKLACSSFYVGKHCSNACCALIRKYLVKQMDVRTATDEATPTFSVDLTFLKNYRMDDLVSCLLNDFGLWMEHGPISSSSGENGKISINNSSEGGEDDVSGPDVNVLKNMFLIWMTLFDRNLIRIRDMDDDDDGAAIFGADASRVLAALLRVGMDPSFNSDNTCGEPLLSLIQHITASLIKTATHQITISKRTDGEDHVWQWIEYTAGVLVDACSDLLAGEDNAADSDDASGDLALAMAVKRMCSYDITAGFTIEIAQMKMMFAQQALHKCLTEINDWEDQVKERTEDLCKDWTIDNASVGSSKKAIHGLITAEIGFQWMDEESESVMSNRPRVLAAVLIAGECALVGAGLFLRSRNNNEHQSESEEEPPLHHVEEQDAVHEIVSNIEALCDSLRKECRAVIAYPHLRRTKEYLLRLSKQLGATKGRSSKDKRKKAREQGSLDSYFSRPSLSQSQSQSDPYRGSQDS